MPMDNLKLKVIQWNARSAYSNHNLLKDLCKNTQFDVGLLCETWYKPNYNIVFSGFNIIRKDRALGKGGIAIFLKKSLPFTLIDFGHNYNKNLEIVGVNITVGKTKISLVSLYRPPNIQVTTNDYIDIFNKLESHCIIGGDFNAHHAMWGSNRTELSGIRLTDAIEHYPKLIIRNDGQPTRLSHANISSVLDLTIVSDNLVNNSKWQALDDTYGSDHFPVLLEVCQQAELAAVNPRHRWTLKNVNWPLYSATILDKLQPIQEDTDANHIMDELIRCISKTADVLFKKINKNGKKKYIPPWWDDDCTKIAQERSNAFKNYKEKKNIENFLQYKNKTAKSKRLFKDKAKKVGWSFVKA